MSRKATIGYFDESTGPSGTTRYLLELLQAMDQSKFQPVFFSLRPYPWHSSMRDMGVELVTLYDAPAPEKQASSAGVEPSPPAPAKKSGKALISSLIPPVLKWSMGISRDTNTLTQLFQKRAVDLLHSNQAGAEIGPIAARQAGVPLVLATWHVDSTYDLENTHGEPHHRRLEKKSMNSLHYAIAVSESTRNDWVQRCSLGPDLQKRISVIYNGINTDKIAPQGSKKAAREKLNLPADRVIIGSLGRLESAKGYEYLIKSLPKIVAQYPHALVVIAGKGPLESSLKQLARDLNVEQYITFFGFTSDINTFLESLDIYVQPSLCEALGFGIIEASAMKLPVVASRIGGIPEVVIPEKTGLLTPVKDPEAIATCLTTLLKDEALRLQMGEAGRMQAISKFTNAQMASQTFDLYHRILAPK